MPHTNLSIAKLAPFHDPRVSLRSAHINGRTYGYIYQARHANVAANNGTIVLIHGFPDLAYGWRYQIPFLASLGLDVIAPDCIGYGRSDSPTHTLADFTIKRIADDINELCSQLELSEQGIILGGHDWGGAIVYRIAQYYPQLIRALFVVCTPYTPPTPTYTPLAELVASKRLPNFGYQLKLASGAIEEFTSNASRQGIRQFLANMYGARTPDGQFGFTAEKGPDLAVQAKITADPPARLITSQELDFYVQEYARNGLRGPLNWYRTRELNYLDEYEFFFNNAGAAKDQQGQGQDKNTEKGPGRPRPQIEQETLFILARKDSVLQAWMSAKMERDIPQLTRREVNASHWALWERPEEVNALIADWLTQKVFSSGAKAKARL